MSRARQALLRGAQLVSGSLARPCGEEALLMANSRQAQPHTLLRHGLPPRRFCATASQPPRRSATEGPVSWTSLALVVLTGGGLVAYYNNEKQKRVEAALSHNLQQKTAGKAAVGGPWKLVDQNGRPFSNDHLKGGFALLYFGFTHCPDICPDELVKLAEAVDLIEKQTGKQVQPVFISVDPARDNVKQVKQYVKEFHPRLIGLTGTPEACAVAARAFRVYHHTTGEAKDYLVDHSIITYLLDPAGDFVTFYGKNVTAEDMAAAVSEHVKRWNAGPTKAV